MTAQKEATAKITLLLFVGLFVVFFSQPHGQSEAPALGEQVPSFTLRDGDGQVIALQDYRGQIVVLNFWATWCPPCIEEMPSLNRLQERYAGQGMQVLAVSVDEDPEAYLNFLTQNEIAFLTLRDPNRRISLQYGTFKLPETYIISRDGLLVNKIIGPADWTSQEMLSYFDSLLAGP